LKSLLVWLGCLGLGLGLWAWFQGHSPPPRAPALSPLLIQEVARRVTVKVLVGQSWGSGVLVARQGHTYTLVTNQHVLQSDSRAQTYQVRTPDGRLHSAQLPVLPAVSSEDVAALRFTSTQTYAIVCRQPQLPAVGDPVFAAGFPFPTEGQTDPGLVFTTGAVRLILPQSLEGGYRLGYTNPIAKGMSGGPVLNGQGQLVALNGMHQYPLWGDPYRYASGDIPAPELRAQLVHYSWGIPIDHVWQALRLGDPPPIHCNDPPSR